MSHDDNTIDYFDLIVQVGKAVVEQTPDHLTPRSYIRQRVQKAFHAVDSYMSTPLAQLAADGRAGATERMKSLCGDLARESLIAAWYFGIQSSNGEDNAETVAGVMTRATVASRVKL